MQALWFFGFLLLVSAAFATVYFLFFIQLVPGAKEERLGSPEPLPEDLGKWSVDTTSPQAASAKQAGLSREVRYLFEENVGLLSQGRLIRQARYRTEQGSIERVDADEVIRRKRLRR